MQVTYFIFLTLLITCLADRPIVTTSLGKIRGRYRTSFDNNTYAAFEGIPYALPPTGVRRFEAPEPPESWDGLLDANSTYECAQKPFIHQNSSGTEDCLYLNVYVPQNRTENLNVIVHIHGGGFMFGSSHLYSFPGYLMDRDVIFVTFNYRLGVFGFLSTEDSIIPGNNGLKDQVMALKWIGNHIASFGGNPHSVTLTGASAGSASVHLHYLSPMSNGLFNRGWSTSGTALNAWAVQGGSLEKATIIGNTLGCSTASSSDLLNCMKKQSSDDILNSVSALYAYKGEPFCIFGPVVEKSKDAFLGEDPQVLLEQKKVQNLPWVVGFAANEGYFFGPSFQNDLEELNSIWTKYASYLLYYHYKLPKSEWGHVAKQIQDHYLGKNEKFSNDNFDKFLKILTDRMFVDGIIKGADLHAKASNELVHVYEFSYTGSTKTVVAHGDEDQYFYYDERRKPHTTEELKMKNFMVNLLVGYAKTGKFESLKEIWKPVKADEFHFLNISGFELKNLELITNKNVGNGQFWSSIGL